MKKTKSVKAAKEPEPAPVAPLQEQFNSLARFKPVVVTLEILDKPNANQRIYTAEAFAKPPQPLFILKAQPESDEPISATHLPDLAGGAVLTVEGNRVVATCRFLDEDVARMVEEGKLMVRTAGTGELTRKGEVYEVSAYKLICLFLDLGEL